jgi:ABC-type Fe3+-hydroxamate transport system substrate-binding protein
VRRLALLLALAVAFAAACGDSGDTAVSTTGAAPATVSSDSTTTTTGPAVSTVAPTTVAASPAVAELLDIESVGLGAVPTGQRRPVLSWTPVAGAARYALVVRAGGDAPYWAWTGTETTIRLGGSGDGENVQLAQLHEAMTWRVSAFDASGRLLAISDVGALRP